MGGKRPDQHNIAPDEARATDYKNMPLEPRDLKAQKNKPKAKELPWSDKHVPRPAGQERTERTEEGVARGDAEGREAAEGA